MKILTKLSAIIGVTLLVLVNPLHAVPIDGSISISGGFVPMGGTGLADTTGIDFLEWSDLEQESISGTSGGTFHADSVSGDFAAYVSTGPAGWGNINDFSFVSPFTPVTPLWEIGGFFFDLTTVVVVEQTDISLILRGVGDVYGNNFDKTEGSWSLYANTLFGETFGWTAHTAVPEPMTLTLFGLGLLGLGRMVHSRRLPLY